MCSDEFDPIDTWLDTSCTQTMIKGCGFQSFSRYLNYFTKWCGNDTENLHITICTLKGN